MTGKTTIEWTHAPGFTGGVWNPTTGCTRVSAGCDNCYAFALHDKRFSQQAMRAKHFGETLEPNPVKRIANARALGRDLPWPKQYDLPFSRVQLLPERLDAPLHVRKPTCYFVDSMSDLFHEDVPDEFIAQVWGAMENQLASHHRFLILTKRPERMRAWVTGHEARQGYLSEGTYVRPTNVWLGTSVEDQASADERIPHLLATPAAVRFLSCEPLLGPVNIHSIACVWRKSENLDVRIGGRHEWDGLHWVIAGGESGPRARPMDLAWARSLRDQCAAAGVSFFMKQFGAHAYSTDPNDDEGDWENDPGRGWTAMSEPHGRDMAEWPEDLRIREFPR